MLLSNSHIAFLVPDNRNMSGFFDQRPMTPNASSIIQATPSKVQPSPTVNTKEALGKYKACLTTTTTT